MPQEDPRFAGAYLPSGLPRYVSRERARQFDEELRARLSGAPAGSVPYATWSQQVDEVARTSGKPLARPEDLMKRLARVGAGPTVEALLRYQESFYREAYEDPSLTIDRGKLDLPEARVRDILDAIRRGEVNYPLVVATPRTVSPPPSGGGGDPDAGHPTLSRFLMDRLIRNQGIPVWQRTDPTVNEFLEQVRDCTLADFTRTDLLGPDGQPLAFRAKTEGDAADAPHPWLPYLQVLYPRLPRPAVTPGYLDLGFVAWERDLPADRVVPIVPYDPRGHRERPLESSEGQVTIQGKSQLDAVSFRYPLITLSQYLALFAQVHAATGQHLDTDTWSWTFGIIDPQRFPDRPSVDVYRSMGELSLYRRHPGYAYSNCRLRSSR